MLDCSRKRLAAQHLSSVQLGRVQGVWSFGVNSKEPRSLSGVPRCVGTANPEDGFENGPDVRALLFYARFHFISRTRARYTRELEATQRVVRLATHISVSCLENGPDGPFSVEWIIAREQLCTRR